ncbi:MAG: response regulator transcription factor [Aquabacterium sp.]
MQRLQTYIIEDSPMIRDNLIATLEELTPVQVAGTSDGESAALVALGPHGPDIDLVIIDIFLREGTGLGVLRQLAEQHHRAKRIVLSNYTTPDMRLRCLELGADRVFDKSHEIDALISYCGQLSTDASAMLAVSPS